MRPPVKLPHPLVLASIHDVSPRFEDEVDRLLDLLSPHVGNRLAMLVVPNHWGSSPIVPGSAFANRLRGWSDGGIEIFLHGYFHRDESIHHRILNRARTVHDRWRRRISGIAERRRRIKDHRRPLFARGHYGPPDQWFHRTGVALPKARCRPSMKWPSPWRKIMVACVRRLDAARPGGVRPPDRRAPKSRLRSPLRPPHARRLCATGRYTARDFAGLRTVMELDDRITAPSFGFGNAANYYRTQSAIGFLDSIRAPALLIQAKDDTFIPFTIFQSAAVRSNPRIELIATEHGGHLGFLGRRPHRFVGRSRDNELDHVTELNANTRIVLGSSGRSGTVATGEQTPQFSHPARDYSRDHDADRGDGGDSGMDRYIAENVSEMGAGRVPRARALRMMRWDPKNYMEMLRRNPQLSREEFEFLKSHTRLTSDIGMMRSTGKSRCTSERSFPRPSS